MINISFRFVILVRLKPIDAKRSVGEAHLVQWSWHRDKSLEDRASDPGTDNCLVMRYRPLGTLLNTYVAPSLTTIKILIICLASTPHHLKSVQRSLPIEASNSRQRTCVLALR